MARGKYERRKADPDAMEVKLSCDQAIQLILFGLDDERSPIVIKDGYEPQRIQITTKGVRFDLVPTKPKPAAAWPEARPPRNPGKRSSG